MPLIIRAKFVKAGGTAGKIVGGWKIAGIQQYQSGGPGSMNVLGFHDYVFTGDNRLWPYEGTNGFLARPNMVPGVNPKSAAALSGHFDPAWDTLLNPAAF